MVENTYFVKIMVYLHYSLYLQTKIEEPISKPLKIHKGLNMQLGKKKK